MRDGSTETRALRLPGRDCPRDHGVRPPVGDAGTSEQASWTAPASGTPSADDGVRALGRDLALPEADGARLTAAPSVCSRCAGEFLYPEDWERNRDGDWNLLMRCPNCEARTRIVLGREAVEDLNRTLYRHAQALAREADALSRRNFEEEAREAGPRSGPRPHPAHGLLTGADAAPPSSVGRDGRIPWPNGPNHLGGYAVIYRFDHTPELRDVTLNVWAAGGRLHYRVMGPASPRLRTSLVTYFIWHNNLRPLRVNGDSYIFSLYLPPIPSPAHNYQLENFLRNRLFGRRTPMAATLALTDACQLDCEHCSAALRPKGKPSLDTAAWKRVIGECVDLGTSVITFTGGEPLLRRDLDELIAAVPRDRAVAEFFCNGLEASPERLAALKAAGAYGIHLSLDDPDEAEHDRGRGREGVFRAVAQAARDARAAGLLVGLSTYADNESVDARKLTRVAALGEEWGVSEISVFDGIRTGKMLRGCGPLHRRAAQAQADRRGARRQPRAPRAAARDHAVVDQQRPRLQPADRVPGRQPAAPRHLTGRPHALRLHAALLRQRAGRPGRRPVVAHARPPRLQEAVRPLPHAVARVPRQVHRHDPRGRQPALSDGRGESRAPGTGGGLTAGRGGTGRMWGEARARGC